ncbi:DUF6519 domain-containing protein [Streptomyces sp. NPDC059875]|uniref:DUF6519 domain-containing protein n=1 Tax=unclassified Streptomyces TaxID=2593676 RepID=UPI0036575BF2
MHGDFTRWTFEPQQAYRAVLLQQGRVLLDADWNEQTAITAHHDEVRTGDAVGPDGGPADSAGFAVVTTALAKPAATPWHDLRITPGRYYVGGTLVEAPASAAPEKAGWPLGDQLYLRTIGEDPAVAEPDANDRYAVLLDVWTHHVTADERAALREPALGGPDTTTRAQTVWGVRLVPLQADQGVAALRAPDSFATTRGTMAALLRKSGTTSDPCGPAAYSGGYRGLENQLYRVEIRDTGDGGPAFVWSRENGSVVASLLAITAAVDGGSAELTLDREGPDEELSIGPDDTVEVTSVDLQLRGRAGFLATVTARRGTRLTVHWTGAAPVSRAALGGTPLVRRWEGPARPLDTRPLDLEDGIQVRFPADGGTRATGDHWLVPARTMRLLHGQTATAGSIDWPPGVDDLGEALPPSGPVRRTAALAILRKADDGWTLEADCRRLFPALIHLTTLDLAGGDSQEAPPGSPLPQPLRVAARNGGLPIVDARVRFVASGGRLEGIGGIDTDRVARTDSHGVARIRWTLDAHGPATQTVTATLLDHEDAQPVVLAGRLRTADQISFAPPTGCGVFGASESVQTALEKVAGRQELRLLGGDGQHLRAEEKVLPQPVRVVVDNACGPVAGASVVATAKAGGLVVKATAAQPPADLSSAGGQTSLPVTTGADGTAAFWWQPASEAASDALELALQGAPGAPLTVTAQALPRERVTAAEVSFAPPTGCGVFGASESVQTALEKVAGRQELRLLGGDGQHRGAQDKVLPQPVRVVVDDACGPVANAQVVATAGAGGLVVKATSAQPPADMSSAGGQASKTEMTSTDGSLAFWWQPATGAASDTLRLALQGAPGAPLTVTAQTLPRERTAAVDISFAPPSGCQGFAASETVQGALQRVVDRRELRLLGGDGQHLGAHDKVLPQPVRVVVDSICRPVKDAPVSATPGAGGLVLKATSAKPPADLSTAGGQTSLTAATGEDGSVALWWQPAPGKPSDTLQLATTSSAAPLIVTAQAPRRGIHITEVKLNGNPSMNLVNGDALTPALLRRGIFARADQDLDQRSINNKGVCYVELDLPWPVVDEPSSWSTERFIGVRTVQLPAREFDSSPPFVQWFALEHTLRWIDLELTAKLTALPDEVKPIVGRFVIEGSAIIGKDSTLRLNCHAPFVLDEAGVTRIQFPTDDSVVGGRFVLTFFLDKTLPT